MLLPVFVLLALATLATPVLADTPVMSVDKWTLFGFDYTPGFSTNTCTITLPKAGCLIVADTYCSGDQFRVTINGQDKGHDHDKIIDPQKQERSAGPFHNQLPKAH
ncbi:hypothetical protein GGF32_002775 [Allomyces javanicus]|nr:hypothetical protein GGF32_002775 [Allomyces javanicus]